MKDESNHKSESVLSLLRQQEKLYIIIVITIIIIILLILYLIEKIIFIILSLITFTPIIAFPIQVFLHLLLIRYIILEIAFSGNNIVISRSLFFNLGKMQASAIYEVLSDFNLSISIFNDIRGLIISLRELSTIQRQIDNLKYIIDIHLEIYNKIKNKFNQLTIDQQLFYNNLNYLKDAICNGNLINFINQTKEIIEKNGKNSLNDIPEEERNNIISQISNQNESNLNIQKISVLAKTLMDQIKDYLGEEYSSFNKRFIRNFFKNKLFASLEQLQIELINKYEVEEYQLITKDKTLIEYIIIKSQKESSRKKLMILCGPNGVPFQIYAKNLRFDNYLQSDIDILCWNYRGYGFSEGKPTYNKLREDILELFDEVKHTLNYERFAVHGISIGGIPSCHLARNRKEIELIICDRNFGRLDNMTQSFPCGKFLFYIYKYFFFQSSDNVDNYLNIKCNKILLNDAKDKIVLETCSLKTLVAQSLCEKYFYCKNDSIELSSAENNNISVGNYHSHNNELESLSSKKNLKQLNTLIISGENNNTSNNKNISQQKELLPNITALDKIFGSVEKKNNFIHSLIIISNIINQDKLEINPKKGYLDKIKNIFKKNSVQYSNLTEEEIQNTSGIFDFVKEHMLEILDSLQGAGDTLLSLIYIERDYTKEIFIDNFFNNMIIWGSVPSNNYGNIHFHSIKNIKNNFKHTIQLFEEFINSQEIMGCKELTIVKEINNIYECFSRIYQNLENIGLNTKNGFIKLIKDELIDEEKNENLDYEECLMELNRGNYVPLNCGHNGALSKEEREIFETFLFKSNFINNEIETIKIENISTNENESLNVNSVDSSTNIINID